MSDHGHWICEKFEPESFGFIYLITNIKNNRKYIGKKQLQFKKSRRLKSRKNRKVSYSESDWKTYTDPVSVKCSQTPIQGGSPRHSPLANSAGRACGTMPPRWSNEPPRAEGQPECPRSRHEAISQRSKSCPKVHSARCWSAAPSAPQPYATPTAKPSSARPPDGA